MPAAELSVVLVHRPAIGPAEIAAVTEVCESGWFGMGEEAREFERRLGEVVGVRHVVGTQSGTAGLHLALEAVGAGPGAEVIVPSFTFAASVQAIRMTGATPVFCEVLPETLAIDVDDACDYDGLDSLAREHGLALVADAAHSFGSSYRGRTVGTLADVSVFSFDASKNITCGDGGAVATDDDGIAARCRSARNLGIDRDSWARRDAQRPWAYEVEGPGYRYRLSNLNAAIGLAQLPRLDEFRERKRAIVRRYDEAFAGLPGLVLPERRLEETCPFLYPIRVPGGARDALVEHLARVNVQAWVHFIPNHLQPAFAEFRIPLPVTERLFEEVATLPLHSALTDDEVARVIAGTVSFAERAAA